MDLVHHVTSQEDMSDCHFLPLGVAGIFVIVCCFMSNGEPAVLVHHGIVRRWCCDSLVTQRPLPWLLSMTYQLLLSMT